MSDASGHSKCQRFLNVPYAQPPIGELRFKRPAAFSSTYRYEVDGTRFGNICVSQLVEDKSFGADTSF